MPRRTNTFQQVIHAIEYSVAGNAKVSESKELPSTIPRVKKDREVDIVIESEVAGHPIVVGVECTRTKRPANVEWVEHMAKKHEHLPTNMLVLVSGGGYSHDALAAAKHYKVEVLTVDEAMVVDWTTIAGGKFQRVYVALPQVWPVGGEIVYADYYPADELPEVTPADVLSDDKGHAETIGQLAERLSRDPSVTEHVLTKLDSTRDRTLTITWTLEPGSRIRDRLVKQLQFRYTVHVEERSPLDLQHFSFRDAQVAYGTFDHSALGAGALLVRVEREGKPPTTAIRVPSTTPGEQPLLLGGSGVPTPAKGGNVADGQP